MQIGKLLIAESAGAVLAAIRLECIHRGLPYFSEFKESGSNIMTRCPFHKGGMERKPSFGVKTDTMICHCFSCGWAGGIDEVISHIFSHVEDGGEYGRKWLAHRFLSVSIDKRAPLNLAARSSRKCTTKQLVVKLFDEEELCKYRYYHDYMFTRGLNDEIIEFFDVGYDCDTDCITFPVYHSDNTPAFIARRSVKGKFFNYPEDVSKPVYAANKILSDLSRIKNMPRGVLITESVFNCLSAWKHGWPAVSLLGLGTEFQYQVLRQLPVRSYVLGMDPDEAGRNAAQKLRKNLGCKVLRQLDIPEGLDINDLDVSGVDISKIPLLL